MGDLQKRILGHMLECTSELENTNHISKILGLAQPTIFKSIRILEKEKYVQTRQENPHGIRTLKLTDKGIAAALFAGEKKDKIYSYLERFAQSSLFFLLMNILYDKNDLDTEWMRVIIQRVLSFEEYKKDQLDERKKRELLAAIIAGPSKDYVNGRKLGSLLGEHERFHLIELLRNKIKSTNSMIDELMYELPNEDKQDPKIVFHRSTFKPKDVFKIELNKRPSINIRKDTNKEMAFDISRADLNGLLRKLKEKSDKVRLQLNKADKEISIAPIIKTNED